MERGLPAIQLLDHRVRTCSEIARIIISIEGTPFMPDDVQYVRHMKP